MKSQRPASPRVALDWSRLLGFDQARRTATQPAERPAADAGLQRIGAKVGGKASAPAR